MIILLTNCKKFYIIKTLCYNCMAKNSINQIRKDEKKIINELLNNSNKSINEIAKNCGFSRQKVWRIIKSLEKNKTIWGYTSVIDEESLDKNSYFILIKRTSKPIEKSLVKKIVDREMESKAKESSISIMNSIYTNGNYDWIIHIETNDKKEANRFCESLKKEFEGFIKEIHLLDQMFPIKKAGITNPNNKDLEKFFDFK